MKINLRKAAALQNVIQEVIRGITVTLNVRLNEFQDPTAVLDARAQDLMVADSRRNDLLVALYTIRAQVGMANAASGVTERLARAAYTDKRLEQLASLVGADEREDMVVITGKLEKIKNRKEEPSRSLYGRDDEVTTGVLPAQAIEQIKKIARDMKKQKQALNDEILELNVRTEIELTQEVVALLQRENLV